MASLAPTKVLATKAFAYRATAGTVVLLAKVWRLAAARSVVGDTTVRRALRSAPGAQRPLATATVYVLKVLTATVYAIALLDT